MLAVPQSDEVEGEAEDEGQRRAVIGETSSLLPSSRRKKEETNTDTDPDPASRITYWGLVQSNTNFRYFLLSYIINRMVRYFRSMSPSCVRSLFSVLYSMRAQSIHQFLLSSSI